MTERQVDARVGGIDPAGEKQEHAVHRGETPEVEDQIVHLRQALIPCRDERRRVDVVLRAESRQQVVAELVGRRERRARPRHLVETKRGGSRRYEALVQVDLHRFRMIYGDEPQLIEIRGLPQFFRESQLVAALPGPEQAAWDVQVFLRGMWRGRHDAALPRHDAQGHAQRAVPHDVGREREAVAVPRVQERAGPLEELLLEHVLFRPRVVDRLRHAVGPAHAQHIRLEPAPEAEVGDPVGHDAQLVEIARAELERRAEPEGVVLAAPLAQPDQVDLYVLIHVPAVVAQQPGPSVPADDDQIEVAVLVVVGHGDRAAGPQAVGGGKDRGVVLEASRGVVAEQEHAAPARRRGLAHDDQIEPAVVVEVEKRGVQAGDAAQLAPELARSRVPLERAVPAVVVQRGLRSVEGRHEQVEEPVIVVIADRDRAGMADSSEPARRRHVLEVPLAQVMEEPDAPVRADEHQIGVAVAIEVAYGRVAAANRRAGSCEAHLRGQLAKRAVEVVAVRPVPGCRRKEEIQIAVVVEIHEQRPRDPGAGRGCRIGQSG